MADIKKKKPRGKGKPFQPGFDPRRNLDGPPRKFDELRAMVQRLFEEEIKVQVGNREEKQKQAEFMLRTWILSQDGFKQNRALEIAYGKVPDEINLNTFDVSRFIQENISLFTDGQLQRLRAGESGEAILAEVIREVVQAKNRRK